MAKSTVRKDLMPAVMAASFTGAAVLHSTNAPANAQHLPHGIYINADAAEVLEFIDVNGVTTTITFAAAFVGYLPFAPTELTANTTAQVVVLWNPEP